MSNTDAAILRYVERLEALEADKKALAEDTKELKAEMKDDGVDAKAIAALVKLRANVKAIRALQTLNDYAAAIQLDLFGATQDEANAA